MRDLPDSIETKSMPLLELAKVVLDLVENAEKIDCLKTGMRINGFLAEAAIRLSTALVEDRAL